MSRTLDLTEGLLAYLFDHVDEHPVLADLRRSTAALPEHGMQIDPVQGAFMAMLVKLTSARRILEIGTFTGYSSTAMALALPDDGRITCCDTSREWTDVARAAWAGAGVAGKVDLRLGRAADTVAAFDESAFDLAFIDADKAGYDTYYEECLRVVRPGGLIIIDNTLWSGRVADPGDDDETVRIIRAFNEKVAADDRVDHVILPLADGLTLARVH